MPVSRFYAEITDQPAALQRVIETYTGEAGRARWPLVPGPGARPVLVGMGASYHCALLGAHFLERRGVAATALEASEVLYQDRSPLEQASALVYISQSGASGEVGPLLDRRPAGTPLIALTNDDDSPLARRADVVLPLLAGDEQTVATKTYLNSLALLWLLAARWSAEADAEAALQAAHARVSALVAEHAATARWWVERLGSAKSLVFLGSGPQAVTARHGAMMAMEWLKVPALSATLGAFRHGPLEIAEAGLGAVLFAAPGPAYESAVRLAEELAGYGTTVVVVEGGEAADLTPHPPSLEGRGCLSPATTGEGTDSLSQEGSKALPEKSAKSQMAAPAEPVGFDAALAPLVDVVPVQLFVEALARERGLPGEFRRISKVVRQV
jgi:glucosamine--fructose-6-phosphate aminotransferase (isomerizing)